MKAFFEKYPHIKYVIQFLLIYVFIFLILENWDNRVYYTTDSWIDQYIPFNEYFVIPYLFWFIYIALGFIYFIFIDQKGFKRTCFYLFVGMFTCLIIYMIWPNQQNLRVNLNNTNIFQTLVSFIYTIDSPTNVCPSIHVYNSIMMMIYLFKSECMKNHKLLSVINIIIAVLICLSTMFIKQHAFVDVVLAIVLCIVIYNIGKNQQIAQYLEKDFS